MSIPRSPFPIQNEKDPLGRVLCPNCMSYVKMVQGSSHTFHICPKCNYSPELGQKVYSSTRPEPMVPRTPCIH